MNKRIKKAFSLVEASIIVVIITIVITAISLSSDLIDDYKLSSARTITDKSPVPYVENLYLWYETTRKESFINNEAEDNRIITRWKDTNPQSSEKIDAYAGSAASSDSSEIFYNVATGATEINTSGPTYVRKGINGLPSLNFDNISATKFQYLVTDSNFSNTKLDDMTMFMVMKLNSITNNVWFLDRTCHDANLASISCGSATSSGLPLFALNLSSTTLRTLARDDSGAGADYSYGSISTATNYIITLHKDYGNIFTTYLNGASVASASDSGSTTTTLDPYKIGIHHTSSSTIDWDISEFIFFNGPISASDRDKIEDYLGRKYNIAVSH